MSHDIIYIGLDAHKSSIHAYVLDPVEGQHQQTYEFPTDTQSVKRWANRMVHRASGRVVCAYEAGPLGFALQRTLIELGLECIVVAPSLIPVKPGDRIKTDRRDARKLAELFRAGLLTEVHPPTREQEAVRDLCRAREDAVQDLQRSKQRLLKFLLRHGHTWRRKNWTQAHHRWLRTIELDQESARMVFDDYQLAIDQIESRQSAIESELGMICQQEPYARPVAHLRCFRGIDTVTAITLVAELHNPERFPSPRELMAYLGLVPSESSSADRQKRGAITKAGNGHVRRILIESSWHYRHRPSVGVTLRKRRQNQPHDVIALADRAQQRLCQRFRRLEARGKPSNKVVTAVARELTGFVWAILNRSNTTATIHSTGS